MKCGFDLVNWRLVNSVVQVLILKILADLGDIRGHKRKQRKTNTLGGQVKVGCLVEELEVCEMLL